MLSKMLSPTSETTSDDSMSCILIRIFHTVIFLCINLSEVVYAGHYLRVKLSNGAVVIAMSVAIMLVSLTTIVTVAKAGTIMLNITITTVKSILIIYLCECPGCFPNVF